MIEFAFKTPSGGKMVKVLLDTMVFYPLAIMHA